ncbi:sugar transferase [Halomicronema hongdechloris]|nr:sugar transferase [Halomicronema hongdechloris]
MSRSVALPITPPVILRLPLMLTVLEAVELKQRCQDALAIGSVSRLILDLSDTTFIDSSGLGALVICRRLCRQQGGVLVLRDVTPQVAMALELASLDSCFVFESSAAVTDHTGHASSSTAFLNTHPSVRCRTKRLLDILGAVVGLGITALLWVPVAIAIKLDDGGPVFFGQIRCSWMGQHFVMWKFRSMVINAEALKHQVCNELEGPLFKNANDPRITRVGQFLRRTSLDEFPQFWNVLQGDMSLVGTRPPTPEELAQYEVPEWQRLDVKPGITGEWQVKGRSCIRRFEEVIRLDLAYQRHWSIWYDLRLMLLTIWVLLTRRGAV